MRLKRRKPIRWTLRQNLEAMQAIYAAPGAEQNVLLLYTPAMAEMAYDAIVKASDRDASDLLPAAREFSRWCWSLDKPVPTAQQVVEQIDAVLHSTPAPHQ